MSGILCTMVGATFAVEAAAEIIRQKKGIIAVGNARISTGASKFGGTSAYFDGTGDYLLVSPTQDFILGENDWTAELWIRPTNNQASVLIDTRVYSQSGDGNGICLYYSGTNLIYYTGGGSRITGGAYTLNTWQHIALVRNGTAHKLYVNGTQVGSTYTATNSITAVNTDYITIATNSNSIGQIVYAGYIDEVRISNSARYTANFTAPTAPFVNDDNTLLLIHGNGTNNSTFIEDDNGTVREPINAWQFGSGIVTSTTQKKFGGTSLYVPNNDTDIYHNQFSAGGTGNALINFGTGNFTVEFWMYANSTNTNTTIGVITKRTYNGTANGTWGIRYNGSNRTITWENIFPSVTSLSTGTSAFSFNTWQHWAFVRNGTTLKIYVDGVEKASGSNSLDFTYYSEPIRIGDWGAGGGNGMAGGYLDEIRISSSARYTSAFTPSTTPFVNDANTILLMHCDGNNSQAFLLDDNGEGRAKVGVQAIGNAQISTAQRKFGGSSASFDGTGDYLTVGSSGNFQYTAGNDVTMELWFKLNSSASGEFNGLISLGSTRGSSSNEWNLFVMINSSTGFNRRLQMGHNYNILIGSTTNLSLDTWYHVAAVRSGTTFKMYLNGVSQGTYTGTLTLGQNTGAKIASLADGSLTSYCWIDEVRISNTARYTADFTAPTAPFANDSNTQLLLHMDGSNASTIFVDDNGKQTYTP